VQCYINVKKKHETLTDKNKNCTMSGKSIGINSLKMKQNLFQKNLWTSQFWFIKIQL
jgi:hypothetical protein